jgi:hypothetical protein
MSGLPQQFDLLKCAGGASDCDTGRRLRRAGAASLFLRIMRR